MWYEFLNCEHNWLNGYIVRKLIHDMMEDNLWVSGAKADFNKWKSLHTMFTYYSVHFFFIYCDKWQLLVYSLQLVATYMYIWLQV